MLASNLHLNTQTNKTLPFFFNQRRVTTVMHTSIQEIKFRGEELTPRENEDLTARLVE